MQFVQVAIDLPDVIIVLLYSYSYAVSYVAS